MDSKNLQHSGIKGLNRRNMLWPMNVSLGINWLKIETMPSFACKL
jgi:hypothetical protein